ncbi:glycosyltransferase family 4 protein [Candidatus Contubernalis alkaliaceticus]|uniref:glycosyltransferase family 4 protein n=1 Tax=Candidatus Contubernalis alkaliaceticus TaxID=338645 RepID=UPI001F4C3800|nr:glycosyltransferase family 1 protein [Candidatus Contubernalis alkalaceticus]UNC93605.1 glycosyltransferase family 4 protein [Candidatus Contubernalis alkalaceticus]
MVKIGVNAAMLSTAKTGIGHYAASLLQALHEVDKENEYYLYSPRPFEASEFKESFHLRVIPSRRTLWWFQKILPQALVQDKIQLFWGGNYSLPLWPKHIKKVVTVHDFVYYKYPKTLPFRINAHLKAAMPLYLKKAHHVLTISHNTARDLVQFYGYPEHKTTVIHLAARGEFFQEPRQNIIEKVLARHSLSPGYMLFVGTVEPRKGVDTILKAFAAYKKKSGTRLLLVIVGQTGWKVQDIPLLIQQLSLQDSVRFLHYVDTEELPILYRGASLFVYPSLYEGFGLPVLEAMASGVPVITSNVSSLPEVAGEAALYVEPGDVQGLCTQMERVLSDKLLQQKLKKLGKAQAQGFSWQKTAEKTLQVFHKLMT